MRFEKLLEEVQRAERRVESRIVHTQSNWQALKTTWRESWTPGRILAIGLAGGFLFARACPLRSLGRVSATRWIQLATSLSGLMASLKAAHAAQSAEAAAGDAESAAEDAAQTVEAAAEGDHTAVAAHDTRDHAEVPLAQAVSDGRRRPDTQWDAQPRPAEAATELSER